MRVCLRCASRHRCTLSVQSMLLGCEMADTYARTRAGSAALIKAYT